MAYHILYNEIKLNKSLVQEIVNFVGMPDKIYTKLYYQAPGIYDPNFKKSYDVSYNEYHRLIYSDCISVLNLVKPNYDSDEDY